MKTTKPGAGLQEPISAQEPLIRRDAAPSRRSQGEAKKEGSSLEAHVVNIKSVFDGAVIGGGVVGLSIALGLAQRGFSVAVIDTGPLTAAIEPANSRVVALNQASQSLLSSLGVWSLIEENALAPYEHMMIWDSSNAAQIEFDCRMIAQDKLGWIVQESMIREALLKRLSDMTTVTLFPSESVKALHEQSGTISIKSETMHWTAKCLFAADGARSICRSLLNVSLTTWPYDQQALVSTVRTSHPHKKTAYQVFNPEGPLAFLPLADPYQCSIVWSTTPDRAKALLALSEEAFNQALTKAFAAQLGDVLESGARFQFPLVMRHVETYVGAHWVFLGDAAHTIHPLAGLGLNLGLADVTGYFDLLDKQSKSGQLLSNRSLQAFQRQRKHAVWQVILLMQGIKMLFSNSLLPVQWLRGVGLRCCNHLPLLKRLFIGYAAG